MSASAVIKVDNVVKSYKGFMGSKSVRALGGISFEADGGEIFGLIGPDGAGKTSAMRIITSLMLPDGGSVSVAGFDTVKNYADIRRIVGYMPGRFSLYQDLSVEENLKFFATIFDADAEENYATIKGIYDALAPFKGRRAGNLSGGMKQKLSLCCALIHKPEILVLDEPTTGVDPLSRQEFWDVLVGLKKQGMTVLVSTPYMDEASRCDKIAFIVKGMINVIDTPENIVSAFPKKIIHARGSEMFGLLKDMRKCPLIESAYAFGDNNHAVLKNGDLEEVRSFLLKSGHADARVEYAKASLEDCFMNLPSHEQRH